MKSNLAATVLTVFVYAQGLLCVAAVATVILRDRSDDTVRVSSQTEQSSPVVVAIRL